MQAVAERFFCILNLLPHLVQCIGNNNYYGRNEINGKILRCSLEFANELLDRVKMALTDSPTGNGFAVYRNSYYGSGSPGCALKTELPRI